MDTGLMIGVISVYIYIMYVYHTDYAYYVEGICTTYETIQFILHMSFYMIYNMQIIFQAL